MAYHKAATAFKPECEAHVSASRQTRNHFVYNAQQGDSPSASSTKTTPPAAAIAPTAQRSRTAVDVASRPPSTTASAGVDDAVADTVGAGEGSGAPLLAVDGAGVGEGEGEGVGGGVGGGVGEGEGAGVGAPVGPAVGDSVLCAANVRGSNLMAIISSSPAPPTHAADENPPKYSAPSVSNWANSMTSSPTVPSCQRDSSSPDRPSITTAAKSNPPALLPATHSPLLNPQ